MSLLGSNTAGQEWRAARILGHPRNHDPVLFGLVFGGGPRPAAVFAVLNENLLGAEPSEVPRQHTGEIGFKRKLGPNLPMARDQSSLCLGPIPLSAKFGSPGLSYASLHIPS